MQTAYTTICADAAAEFKDKGSRFLAFAYPIGDEDDVKTRVQALQKEHHKAVHWCYAYRLGVRGTRFRANDDGEPSGSAGRPILGQIDSADLTDVLVVVVRYFGGVLLGVPGLIHAYKTAAALALANAPKIEKEIQKMVHLRCEYPHLSEALRLVKQHGATVVSQDLQMDCCLKVNIPLAHYAACLSAWQQTRAMIITEEDEC
ncbi:IMPACT family protein [Stenoxybacter acetivorans]|uniref:IMPACT family protein n=1 Tax=Stenoxybacter acetivorans TaxID=422441 RepID=UPI0012EC0AA2|nr:YigZ family protein [Stenoxybacter acetivorans]